MEAKFGVGPDRIPDYLALIGDTSDNIPGLAGVGPKTATKWLLEYGDLETVIAKANYIKPPRFQQKVAAQAEDLRRNLKMVTLDLSHTVEGLEPRARVDVDAVVSVLEELEMKTAARDCRKRYGEGDG